MAGYKGMFDDDFYSYANRPGNTSYLTGSSQAPMQGEQAAEILGSGGSAAALPFMATPAGAAAVVGSQFLSQYLAQKAADERARRERSAQIAQEHGAAEQRGFDQLINVYRGALR